jgi:hypothetical protein
MSLNFWNFGERNQQEPIPPKKKKNEKEKKGEKGRKNQIILGEVFFKQEEFKPIFLMNI